MNTKQEIQKKKKAYHSPKVINYGQLQEWTAGGTGTVLEDMANQMNKVLP